MDLGLGHWLVNLKQKYRVKYLLLKQVMQEILNFPFLISILFFSTESFQPSPRKPILCFTLKTSFMYRVSPGILNIPKTRFLTYKAHHKCIKVSQVFA